MSDSLLVKPRIASWEPAVRDLKAYLDDIGYHGIYKYLVAVNFYSLSPSMFNENQPGFLGTFDRQIHGEGTDWNLARCLTTCQPVPLASLTERERTLAAALAEAGLTRIEGDTVTHGGRQLLSVRENYLFIDAAIHFSCGRVHEIYIGPDSYMLLYYLNGGRTRPNRRALDLCTGSGVIGLTMAQFCDQVVCTDIAPAPLELVPINRTLNGLDGAVEVREENLKDTLASPERFDLITCNPPFVASPPGLPTPIYAQGTGRDGLDYLRLLVDRTPEKLNPGGEGLFVVDLPGDYHQPYYFAELEAVAKERGLYVEAYIDNRLKGDLQIQPFTTFLRRMHPDVPVEEIERQTTHFIREDLKAHFYYLTTIRVRKRETAAGLRVFSRYRVTTFDGFFSRAS